MLRLELRIPPLLLSILFAALMWLAALMSPVVALPEHLGKILIIDFVIAGLVVICAGLAAFIAAKTTVDPTRPGRSSSLVTTGIYKFTRNPMYLGLLCLLVAWAIYLSSPLSLLIAMGFIPYMNRFQIRPEERSLEKVFGEHYAEYKRQVRRWLM